MVFKQKTAYEIGVRLVGSEMCIRDRIETVPFPIQHLPYFLVLRKLLLVVGICVGGGVSCGVFLISCITLFCD